MKINAVILLISIVLTFPCSAQTSSNLTAISIENDQQFEGFELLQPVDKKLFVLAEHWHNIRSVPKATLKVLRYLHNEANVRVLAIEQGASAAYMINHYLATGDTVMLRQIVRNTMFWGKENHAFFQDLFAFNQTLPENERISVQSIDIEYKMESAIFVINQWLEGKEIPEALEQTVGNFRRIYEETKGHREQFNGLAVMFYYDKDFVSDLVDLTLIDLESQPTAYEELFGKQAAQFTTMIKDMRDGLRFDYTNPLTNYKFRDRLIHTKFLELVDSHPGAGILCVIGMRHATKGSSIYKLNTQVDSPLKDKVMNIRISALYNKSFMSGDLRRINFAYPKQLKLNTATLIRHDASDPTLKSKKSFDYTLFINEDGSLTAFDNVFKGEY